MKIEKNYIYYLTLLTLFFPVLGFAQGESCGNTSILNPSAVACGTDASVQYLATIFGVVDGVLHGSGTQIMGKMFGVFNAAVLALGGIIVLYTLTVSTLNTANEGEILGKKFSSIWVPVRSAVGIGLLLPKATGYSVIQIFVMWVVVQGVGAADSIWNAALNYLASGGLIVQTSAAAQNDLMQPIENILRAEVCVYGIQAALNASQQAQYQNSQNHSNNQVSSVPLITSTLAPFKIYDDKINNWTNNCSPGASCYVYFPGDLSSQTSSNGPNYNDLTGICGATSWTNISTNDLPKSLQDSNKEAWDDILKSRQIAVQQIILDLAGPAQSIVNTLLNTDTNGNLVATANQITLNPRLFLDTAEDYQGIMQPAIGAMSNAGGIGKSFYKKAQSEGWLFAGSYYLSIAQLNKVAKSGGYGAPMGVTTGNDARGTINGFLTGMQPFGTVTPGSPPVQTSRTIALSTILSSLPNGRGNAQAVINVAAPDVSGGGSDTSALTNFINEGTIAYEKGASSYGGANLFHGGNVAAKAVSGVSGVLGIIFPMIGSLIGIVNGFSELLASQSGNLNPIASLAIIGNNLIGFVIMVWVAGTLGIGILTLAAAAVPCFNFSNLVSNEITWITPFLWGALGTLFVTGVTMSFYLPLIPFLLFTFGVIGWFITVIEAMVAAPLVALGITHPEGHEIVGRADPAIMLLLNVFLRPCLMIIGFIAGIILSYVGIWIFNRGFGYVWGTLFTGMWYNLNFLAMVFAMVPAMFVIYVTIAIAILNQAFSLINVVPDRVLRWIGGTVQEMAPEAARMLGEGKAGLESGAGVAAKGMEAEGGDMAKKRKKAKKGKIDL